MAQWPPRLYASVCSYVKDLGIIINASGEILIIYKKMDIHLKKFHIFRQNFIKVTFLPTTSLLLLTTE